MTGGFLDVLGARLWYEEAGSGSAVVFLHEGIADARMWEPQWQPFAQRFRVVRFDMRGYGRSDEPGGPFALVDDAAAVIDRLDAGPAAIVGGSLGGRVALELAVLRPDAVRALVLQAPGLGEPFTSEELRSAMDAEEEALDRGDIGAAVRPNLDIWVAGPRRSLDAVDPAIVSLVADMQRRAFEIQLPVWESSTPPEPQERIAGPLVERLGSIAAPTLVLIGDEDVSDLQDAARRVAAAIPGAQLETIAGAAHVANLERPDEFNRLALEFLDAAMLPGVAD